jgi:hypothetical protein
LLEIFYAKIISKKTLLWANELLLSNKQRFMFIS